MNWIDLILISYATYLVLQLSRRAKDFQVVRIPMRPDT